MDNEMSMNIEPPEPVRSVRADMAERTGRAWAARVAGASWQQAASVSGYTDGSNCRRAVTSVYGQLPKVEREDMRHLWRERLELAWRQVVRDMADRQPGAVTAAVRVAQAAVALDGLAAPSVIELSSPSEREIVAWVDAMVAQARPALEEADIFADPPDAEVIETSDP